MADKSASNGHGPSFSNGAGPEHGWFCPCTYCLQGHK